jgi:S1-C subfamily serine protease
MSRPRARAATRTASGNWRTHDTAAARRVRKPRCASLFYMIAAIGLLGSKGMCGENDGISRFEARAPGAEARRPVDDSLRVRGLFSPAVRGGLLRSGTAFFVTQAGEMLTSAHVVRGCARLEVWPEDGLGIPASIESIDEHLDVALLATQHRVNQIAVHGHGSVPRNGSVFTIGFGLTPSSPLVPIFTHGVVEGDTEVRGRRLLVLRAALYEGNSGGPVIDSGGHLVGMVIGRYVDKPELSVAVRVSELAKFLGPGRSLASSSTGRAVDVEPQAELRGISALVQCIN